MRWTGTSLTGPEDAMDGTSFTVVDVLCGGHSVTASCGVTMIMSPSPVVAWCTGNTIYIFVYLPDATPEEIKKAYYNCMKSCHPDLSGNDPETTNFCMFVNDVYERMVYDEIHGYAVTATNPFLDDSSPKDHVFVDEFACIGCKNCANVAPDIFKIEEDFGRARACNQRGNPDLLQQAVETWLIEHVKDYFKRTKENGFIDVRNRKVNSFHLFNFVIVTAKEHGVWHGLTPYPFCVVKKFEYRVTEESQKDRLTTNTHEACLPIHENSRVLTAHGSNRIVYVIDDHVDISTSNPDTGISAVELSLNRILNSRTDSNPTNSTQL
ncbi:unnamed protein product [Brassica oleracea]